MPGINNYKLTINNDFEVYLKLKCKYKTQCNDMQI